MPTTQLLSVLLLTTSAAFTAAAAGKPPARHVGAEIALDGVVVLRGSTSDDGHPDADAVWDYQLGQLTYAPTDAFAKLGVPADAVEWTLASAPAPARGARPAQVRVEVRYGGGVTTHELALVRVPRTPNGGEWRVQARDVERLFAGRSITRREAANLTTPARTK